MVVKPDFCPSILHGTVRLRLLQRIGTLLLWYPGSAGFEDRRDDSICLIFRGAVERIVSDCRFNDITVLGLLYFRRWRFVFMRVTRWLWPNTQGCRRRGLSNFIGFGRCNTSRIRFSRSWNGGELLRVVTLIWSGRLDLGIYETFLPWIF